MVARPEKNNCFYHPKIPTNAKHKTENVVSVDATVYPPNSTYYTESHIFLPSCAQLQVFRQDPVPLYRLPTPISPLAQAICNLLQPESALFPTGPRECRAYNTPTHCRSISVTRPCEYPRRQEPRHIRQYLFLRDYQGLVCCVLRWSKVCHLDHRTPLRCRVSQKSRKARRGQKPTLPKVADVRVVIRDFRNFTPTPFIAQRPIVFQALSPRVFVKFNPRRIIRHDLLLRRDRPIARKLEILRPCFVLLEFLSSHSSADPLRVGICEKN